MQANGESIAITSVLLPGQPCDSNGADFPATFLFLFTFSPQPVSTSETRGSGGSDEMAVAKVGLCASRSQVFYDYFPIDSLSCKDRMGTGIPSRPRPHATPGDR